MIRTRERLIKYARPSALALLLLVLSYWFSNLDITISDESEILKWFSFARSILVRNQPEELYSDYVLVNVGYDKVLVDSVKDDNDLYAGNIDITDRHKLMEFLRILKQYKNFRYLMLDIDLSNKYPTAYDDSLFNIISSFDSTRVAIGINGENDTIMYDKRLRGICCPTNYRQTFIESDMLKTPLFFNGKPSFALKAYQDIEKRRIKKVGCIYIDKRDKTEHVPFKLSRSSIYPKLFFNDNQDIFEEDDGVVFKNMIYYNLGSRILKSYSSPSRAKDFFNNKIIVVGTFNRHTYDSHYTYAGEMSGAFIQLNILHSLRNGIHCISFWVILTYYTIFFLVSYLLFYRKQEHIVNTRIKLGWNKKTLGSIVVPIALIWTYYSLILIIIGTIVFIMSGELYDVYFTSTLLTIIDFVFRKIKKTI